MPAVCPVAVSRLSLFGGQGKLSHRKTLIFFSASFWFSQSRTEVLPCLLQRLPSNARDKNSCGCLLWNFLLISLHHFYWKSNASSFPLSYWMMYAYIAFLSPVFCSFLHLLKPAILPTQPEISGLSSGNLEVLLQWQCLCTARAEQRMREAVSFFHAPLCLQP